MLVNKRFRMFGLAFLFCLSLVFAVENSPPNLFPIGDKGVLDGEEISFIVNAEDFDNDTITYSLSYLPPGASFDENTGEFIWNPDGITQSVIIDILRDSGFIAARDTQKDNIWREKAPVTVFSDGDDKKWNMFYYKPYEQTNDQIRDVIFYNYWWQFEESYRVDRDDNDNLYLMSSVRPTNTSYAIVNLEDYQDKITSDFYVYDDGEYVIEIFGYTGYLTPDDPYYRLNRTTNVYVNDVLINSSFLIPSNSSECATIKDWHYCPYFLEANLTSGKNSLSVEVKDPIWNRIRVDKFRVFLKDGEDLFPLQEDIIPILGYHYVVPDGSVITKPTLEMNESQFRSQMNYFTNELGCNWITFGDLMENYVLAEIKTPEKSCVITFDDGRDNNYDYAFPIMEEFNAVGSFYVPSDFINTPDHMTLEEIIELEGAGNEIGAHSINHIHLGIDNLSYDELVYEIAGSKEVLEGYGFNVRTYAHPFGEWTISERLPYEITFFADDGFNIVNETITLEVFTEEGFNTVPVFTQISDKSVDEEENLRLYISATDKDNDELTYTVQGLPSGASFNEDSQAFSWTPSRSQSGLYEVNFTAFDGRDSAKMSVKIRVRNIDPPSGGSGFKTLKINDSNYEKVGEEIIDDDKNLQVVLSSSKKSLLIGEDYVINFMFRGEDYVITFFDLKESSSKSSLSEIVMLKNIEYEFDLNGDDVLDLLIVYRGLNGDDGSFDLYFIKKDTSLAESLDTQVVELELSQFESSSESSTDDTESASDALTGYTFLNVPSKGIAAAGLMLVLIILGIVIFV